MPRRDPETGQYVSNGGASNLTYADHDVHHVKHSVTWLDTADSGPSDSLENIQQFEITERGLDPDELAELRAMRVSLSLAPVSSISQDEIGSVTAQFGAGFNLTGDEFLDAVGTADSTTVDTDDSGTDDFSVSTRDTDEVGQLFSDRLSMYAGYSDTTDGTGGASTGAYSEFMLHFPSITGTGPVVDAVDDFSSRVYLRADNMVASVGAVATYQLFYAVEEQEGGRTRFGR